jgi:hypothetical protein
MVEEYEAHSEGELGGLRDLTRQTKETNSPSFIDKLVLILLTLIC